LSPLWCGAQCQDAIRSRDWLKAGEEASRLITDTTILTLGLVPGGQVPAFLLDVTAEFADGINGESCIVQKGQEFKQWTKGFLSEQATKIAAFGKKLLSIEVDSPADLFVSDSAGNVTSVMGTGTVAEGIPNSKALLLKTGEPIKIVNVLEASDQYQIRLEGTGGGGTGLTVLHPRSDGSVIKVTYANIPTTTSSEATIKLDANTKDYVLTLDVNGDSTIDQQVSPDSVEKIVEGITVKIDIKPGDKRNIINLRSKDVVPVAILTTSTVKGDTLDFDATQVEPKAVKFGPNKAKSVSHKTKDIDHDGDKDLILRFKIRKAGIACGDTKATLTGKTFSGQAFTGSDFIKTVGCKLK
jgi:hypothetical protein